MLYLKAAFESSCFQLEIKIQRNDSVSLAASKQEKLLGEHFQKAYSVYLIRCLWGVMIKNKSDWTEYWCFR